MGGEEFAVLLPATTACGALTVAERFRECLEDFPIFTTDQAIHVTISIGIAEYEPDMTSVDELLIRADNMLYQAKNNGRNRTIVSRE